MITLGVITHESKDYTMLTWVTLLFIKLSTMLSGGEQSATFPTPFKLGLSQIDYAEGVSSHTIGPVRTDKRHAFADFFRLFCAAIQAFSSDHVEQWGCAYTGLVKFIRCDLAGITSDPRLPIDLEMGWFKQDIRGSFSHRPRPAIYCRNFTHILLYHTKEKCQYYFSLTYLDSSLRC